MGVGAEATVDWGILAGAGSCRPGYCKLAPAPSAGRHLVDPYTLSVGAGSWTAAGAGPLHLRISATCAACQGRGPSPPEEAWGSSRGSVGARCPGPGR